MTDTPSPYARFKTKLDAFARGQHGIRNPFVIAAVEPSMEHRVSDRLADWATDGDESLDVGADVTVQPIWLDELLPKTDVYNLCVDLGDSLNSLGGGETAGERIEGTMQDRLAEELVQSMVADEIDNDDLESQSHIVLLLNLGSLFPFTRASELLDELDRRNVKSTIGIPFPGDTVGGKLSFFGSDSRHYYPAHQIDGQIKEVHLQ